MTITRNSTNYKQVRVAILADSSIQHLAEVLKVTLRDRRLDAEIYSGEFDTIDQDVFDKGSALYKSRPDFIWLHTSTHPLQAKWYSQAEPARESAQTILDRTLARWDAVGKNSTARVIQNLYACPSDRLFGNFSGKIAESFYSTLRKLNLEIIERSRLYKNVFLNDLDYVLSYFGRKEWEAERYWYEAKLCCNPALFPAVVKGVADIVTCHLGQAKKCVIVDLDDTLWGGTIAEDGVAEIRLGGTGEGECFVDFQRYLLSLKSRGILICVCSKNSHADALEPFERHPEMILKPADLSAFVANWEPKSKNVAEIVKQLDIGMDSVVFLDDSAFERNEVRTRFQEVTVPELPADPGEYVPFLNNLNLFETVSFTEEDKVRTRQYKEEVDREASKHDFGDISDYLKSLGMRANFARFDQQSLPRIVQLIERSNQFNLTTSRYDLKRCEAFAEDTSGRLAFYVKLKDKFGDYGLVSAIFLHPSGGSLFIDEWVMSCRVLRRGVEKYIINKAVEEARRLGIKRIQGVFKPTAKNQLVKELYAELGFEKISSSANGETSWSLKVAEDSKREAFIQDDAREPG